MFNNPDYIFTYTRAQAIADGVLVDITEAASTAGFRLPFVVSESVYIRFIAGEECGLADRQGRLLSATFAQALRFAKEGRTGDRIRFDFADERGSEALILHIGPGDAGEPVLTLMTPHDD